jgi:hypothetical protein
VKVYLQDELSPHNKVELSRGNKGALLPRLGEKATPWPRRARRVPNRCQILGPFSSVPAEQGIKKNMGRACQSDPYLQAAESNMFRMIFLQQIAMQLPWNDILNRK